MSSLNKVQIIGRVGKDPEVKQIGENQVANFSVATSEKIKGEERTEWHRCSAWGKTAELIGKYVAKGALVYVEGKIQTRTYEKGGEKRYSTEIMVQSIQFLSKRGEVSDVEAAAVASIPAAPVFNQDEDLPF